MWPDAPAHLFGDDRGSDSIAEQMPWLAGLITAGAISSLVCSAPPSRSLSWGEVVLSAAVCVLAAFLSGAAAAWVLGSIISFQPPLRARRGVLKIACVAAGFAPLSLFLQERSVLGMAVAAGLAAAATLWFSECDEASGQALRAKRFSRPVGRSGVCGSARTAPASRSAARVVGGGMRRGGRAGADDQSCRDGSRLVRREFRSVSAILRPAGPAPSISSGEQGGQPTLPASGAGAGAVV